MQQEFTQAIKDAAKKATDQMHTAIPGQIVSFDAATSRATVKPSMKFAKPNGETLDYPLIYGVPVLFPQSAGVHIAYPVKPNDGCLIIVCEGAIDQWMYGHETDTQLKFDLTNSVAICGLFTSGNEAVKKAQADDAVVLKSGSTEIEVKADGVYITGNTYIKGNLRLEGNMTTVGGGGGNGSATFSGDVVAGSISLQRHTHPGCQGGSTGTPR